MGLFFFLILDCHSKKNWSSCFFHILLKEMHISWICSILKCLCNFMLTLCIIKKWYYMTYKPCLKFLNHVIKYIIFCSHYGLIVFESGQITSLNSFPRLFNKFTTTSLLAIYLWFNLYLRSIFMLGMVLFRLVV